MKKTATIITFLITFFAIAQNANVIDDTQKNFRNQGEQEEYWTKELFEKEYSEQEHEKFGGAISVESNSIIKFDNKTLNIWAIDPILLKIFTNGILYPQLIIGDEKNRLPQSKAELDSLCGSERLAYFLAKNDSLKISDFKELKFLSITPKKKRFTFWVYNSGFMNPQVYFIELTNKKATKKTNMDAFINGSQLTYLKAGWLII